MLKVTLSIITIIHYHFWGNSMPKIAIVAAIAASFFASGAQSAAIVSNVSYTSNSITYTETGDMTGYATPAIPSEFGIVYTGNLFSYAGYRSNQFSGSLFTSNNPSNNDGNTGNFGGPNNYTWFAAGSGGSSVFSGTPFTISWSGPMLNTSGSGLLEFVWGNGFGAPTTDTIINSVEVSNGNLANNNTVPEPATIALLACGLAGLAFSLRKRV